MKKIIFLALSLSFIIADINISGDGRIRPRLDVIDYGNGESSVDLYYLYRARLDINADIGSGWFFNTKLGTNNNIAGMVKMATDDGPGNPNSARPQLNFLNLYYGIKKDNFGFWGGAIPLNYSSGLDIHFYPDKMVDIPFLLFNNASTTGFAGYIYKLNWFISIDNNKAEITKENNITSKYIDPFTIGFDFPMKWNTYLDVHPRAFISLNNKAEPGPMTFGIDMNFMEFFKVDPTLSYHYSTQFTNENNKYNATHLRFKLNIINFTFWSDMAQYVDVTNNNETIDYMYVWIDYNYKLFDSEMGSVFIKPTIRYQSGQSGNPDYSRMKFELTTEIKFK